MTVFRVSQQSINGLHDARLIINIFHIASTTFIDCVRITPNNKHP